MVPFVVPAVIVNQEVTLDPLHSPVLLAAQPAGTKWGGRHRATPSRCIGRATTRFEVCEFSDEWLVAVIGLVLSILGRPGGCIPYGSIHPHWPQGECCCALSGVSPDRNIIHEEYNLLRIPEDGIVMKMSGGIEPQMELHLSPNYPPIATSPDVNVRLQRVRLPKRSPKELDIHLIMEPRMSFVVRKIEGGYDSCSITRLELDGSTKIARSKGFHGLKPAT